MPRYYDATVSRYLERRSIRGRRERSDGNENDVTHGSNEKEISHATVSWQTRRRCTAVGSLPSSIG